MDIRHLTAFELAEQIKNRTLNAVDAVETYLTAIESEDKEIKGYITVCKEEARQAAALLDEAALNGRFCGVLHGVPVAIKDNLCTQGIRTTCASRILGNYLPVYDATVVTKLKAAGAVILGKTNMDEFAMGSSTENSYFGPSRNPQDKTRIPGGSSGGSAAVVAARLAPCALGSDTGGSIRQPAACCGVTGIKPTYGRVSRYGLVAFASSLDQIGPITRDVRDAALLLNVLCGWDAHDSTSSDQEVPDFLSSYERGVEGLSIGLPKEYLGHGLDSEMRQAVLSAADKLKRAGARVVEVSLPSLEFAVATYYILATAEASSNLARYDGVKYGFRSKTVDSLKEMYETTRSQGFGAEVKRRIMLGTYVLSAGYYDAYYRKAQQVRALICRDFDQAFQSCDLILGPTLPSPPFKLGEKSADPLAMYLSDIYTISLNLSGLPGLTIPLCKAGGLPAGIQIIGRGYDEATVLRAARSLEQ